MKIFIALILIANIARADNIRVTEIINESSIKLEDNRVVELADIIALVSAKEFLEASLLAQNIILDKPQTNRYDNILAHVKTKNGMWVQGEMLKKGLAYIYPTSNDTLLVKQMLELEKTARENKLGIWQNNDLGPVSTKELEANLSKFKNKFKIIEGRVTDIAKTYRNIYINFGDNWQEDFTIIIAREDWHNFSLEEIESLKGQQISARGWIESYNGPMIKMKTSSINLVQ